MRSKNDNTIEAKLEAMEWMSRYMKFINPGNINLIVKEFKAEFMTAQMTQQR